MRAQSLDDIARLTQTTLPRSFGKPFAEYYLPRVQRLRNEVRVQVWFRWQVIRPVLCLLLANSSMVRTSTWVVTPEINEIHSNTNVNATHLGTSNTLRRPALLKDVKQILDANKYRAPNTNFRPTVNATSTPSGGAVKKQRRGGKKHKEMMAKRVEREKNGQNKTTVNFNSAPLQKQHKAMHIPLELGQSVMQVKMPPYINGLTTARLTFSYFLPKIQFFMIFEIFS